MIKFEQHDKGGYAERTFENAKADFTLAIATNFKSPGEVLTQKACKIHENHYYALQWEYAKWRDIVDRTIVPLIDDNICLTWNIAGNSLDAFLRANKNYTQGEIDSRVFRIIERLYTRVHVKPFHIYSGGQTGVDEAGLKAGSNLGIESKCLAPRNWMFRNELGSDIKDKVRFLMGTTTLKRFRDYIK